MTGRESLMEARDLAWQVRDDGPNRDGALAELVRRAELYETSQTLLVSLREALDEEQARARTFMRVQGRRNAAPAAIDDMVERVFFGLARRAMKLMSRSGRAHIKVEYQVWDYTTSNLLGEFDIRADAEEFIGRIRPYGRFGVDGHDLRVVEEEVL